MKYLNYLFSLQNAGSKYSLDRMKKLIDLLGNPQNKIKTIHIAGSNGKGSCAAFLDSILTEAGYSVGVYTSPHLIRLNERIVVDGVQITDTELEQSVKTIKDIATKHKLEITFFEYITAIAFIYFAYKDVDIAIIEVGLGGRLDATNIITPLVSIITNISLEHTTILGDTKEKIALEKAAIIKQNVPLVTAEQDSTICSLFTKICTESKSMYAHIDDVTPLTENHVGNDIHYFSLTGKIGGTYKIQMQGIHQIT
ncbi:TPA: bifunctional folylpolyglutamate synthase/dihydrofolate synthase, partial [Candidatus Woesearchaeota archaeon]|nr:bifunctional folylpolyglutamate synthase/dihydrofolate synthase [Candidatus Woesearchaeota archaeon]